MHPAHFNVLRYREIFHIRFLVMSFTSEPEKTAALSSDDVHTVRLHNGKVWIHFLAHDQLRGVKFRISLPLLFYF